MQGAYGMKVFITGASSGIGEALAHEYAKRHQNQGAFIGLVSRRSERLQELKNTLEEKYKVTCACYTCDVRDAAALTNAAHHFLQQYGTPDIVIANAGVSSGTMTAQAEDTATFQAIMEINVLGLVHTFQPFITTMQQIKQGQLVGIASVAGVRGLPGAGAYSASKAAAIAYLESLRVEMSHHNISVTTIAPGYIRTPMTNINTYSMPFLMDVEIAASKFVDAIERQRRFVVIPWQMGWVARLMRILPPAIWDWLTKNAPQKPHIDIER